MRSPAKAFWSTLFVVCDRHLHSFVCCRSFGGKACGNWEHVSWDCGRKSLRYPAGTASKHRADSRFVPSQWETELLCNRNGNIAVSVLNIYLASKLRYHYIDIKRAAWCLKTLATRLFVQQFIWTDIMTNIKVPYYLPFVRGICWWLVVPPHRRPVIRKVFPCYYIIMIIYWTC